MGRAEKKGFIGLIEFIGFEGKNIGFEDPRIPGVEGKRKGLLGLLSSLSYLG